MHIYKLKGCPHCLSTERLESSQTQSGMLTVIEWDIRSPEWRDGAQWEGGYSAFVTTDDRVKFESHHFPTHTHTHSSSHYRTPRSRNGTAPDRIENLALVRPPGQLDVMLVYAARYVPKKQRRWWNAVRVIFSCTTPLSLSRDLLWLCTLSTWVADRDGSEIFIFSLLAGHRLREKYFWYLFVCTYFRNGWKCRVQIFQPRKMPNTQHTQKGNEEIGNWRELAVSSCLLDK